MLGHVLEEHDTSSPDAHLLVPGVVSIPANFIAITDQPARALAPRRRREVAIPTDREIAHADAPKQAAGDGDEVRTLELQKLRVYQYRCLRYECPSKPCEYMRFWAMESALKYPVYSMLRNTSSGPEIGPHFG
jgi:hypothetical protein